MELSTVARQLCLRIANKIEVLNLIEFGFKTARSLRARSFRN